MDLNLILLILFVALVYLLLTGYNILGGFSDCKLGGDIPSLYDDGHCIQL
jgi:hypothetical protein